MKVLAKSLAKSLAQADIAAFRRSYLLAVLARSALGVASFAGATLLLLPTSGDRWLLGAVLLGGAIAVYLGLSWRSVKLSREGQAVAELIARGESEIAEQMLTRSLRQFSLFPRQQVVDLYHLAVLRQGQARFAEAAELAAAVVQTNRFTPGVAAPSASHHRALAVASSIVRLESLLSLGQLPAAYEVLASLTGVSLNLSDRVRLLSSRLRYEVLVGAFDHALSSVAEKLRLIDLMPPMPYANAHLMLAYAAKQTGREALGRWLVARAMASLPADRPSTQNGADEGYPQVPPELAPWWEEELARVRTA